MIPVKKGVVCLQFCWRKCNNEGSGIINMPLGSKTVFLRPWSLELKLKKWRNQLWTDKQPHLNSIDTLMQALISLLATTTTKSLSHYVRSATWIMSHHCASYLRKTFSLINKQPTANQERVSCAWTCVETSTGDSRPF